jgi:hypothetical protein
MVYPIIMYYPVGNGDTSLVRLEDKTTIIIDCNLTKDSRDDDIEHRYNVHKSLLAELERDAGGSPFVDAFINTHPDQDHLRGFGETFHTGDPGDYKSDEENEKIIISELWFSRRIFSNFEDSLSVDAEVFFEEAKRRIEIYRSGSSKKDLPGNRIHVIGYGESELTSGLDAITTVPGNYINKINGSAKDHFKFFVHAPFKKDVDSGVVERNNTSVVLQAIFKVSKVERAGLALFGGDAKWDIWEKILNKSDIETLEWDLFLAPHHCSWSFFNEVPYTEGDSASKSSLDIIEKRRSGAIVIVSSKEIKDDDDNPPHYAASKLYKKLVGKDKFICTAENPSVERPEPIIFSITSNGPVREETTTSSSIISLNAAQAALIKPRTYGKK